MQTFLLLLALVTLASCTHSAPTPKPATSPRRQLTVVATADFHGALEPEELKTADGKVVHAGGAALLASYLKILKKQNPGPLVWVDAGDLFQGSMASNRFEGSPVIRFYNSLGLQAAALGNHEFDYGPTGKKSVPRSPQDDPQGALKRRIHEARFPFLAANVRDEKGQIPTWLKASIIVETEGARVGIVGVADPETPHTTNALNLGGLTFLAPAPVIQAEAERLRTIEKVDAVVAIMHIGAGCERNDAAVLEDLSSCKLTDAFAVVKQLPEGLVDVVVAGHTHRGVAKRIGRTLVLQAYSHGKALAWATMPLQTKGAKPEWGGLENVCQEVVSTGTGQSCDPVVVKKAKGDIIPAKFLGETVEPDTSVLRLLAPEMKKVEAIRSKQLGSSAVGLFTKSYEKESALGNLVADLTREGAPQADLGLANGGGLRADLAEGPITYGSLYSVLPFDNQLAVMLVPGSTVIDLVKLGLFDGKGFLSWSSNLRLTADGCELKELQVNGQPVRKNRLYAIATSDYLAGGGSGVSSLHIPAHSVKVYWDSPYILRDVISRRLSQKKGKLDPKNFFQPEHPRQKISGACERGTAINARAQEK